MAKKTKHTETEKTVSEKKTSPKPKKEVEETTKTKPEKKKNPITEKKQAPIQPKDNEPVTLAQFKNGYKVLNGLIGLLALFSLLNFLILLTIIWTLGVPVSFADEESYRQRLFKTEEKIDATIEGLPAQFQPKIDFNVVKPDKEVDRWKGNKDSRYVWIKYSDLECPYCSAVQPQLDQFLESNSEEVALIFRNLPLANHANAQALAETAECVAKYNGESEFWNFVEAQYNGTIPATIQGEEQLSQYVQNAPQVASCVESGEATDKIERDISDAVEVGIGGTPTFVIFDMQTDESYYVRNPGSLAGMESELKSFKEKEKETTGSFNLFGIFGM